MTKCNAKNGDTVAIGPIHVRVSMVQEKVDVRYVRTLVRAVTESTATHLNCAVCGMTSAHPVRALTHFDAERSWLKKPVQKWLSIFGKQRPAFVNKYLPPPPFLGV